MIIRVELYVRNSEGKLFEVKNNSSCFMVVPELNEYENYNYTSRDVLIVHHFRTGIIDFIELFERCDTEIRANQIKEYVFNKLHEKKEKMIERRALNRMLKRNELDEKQKASIKPLVENCLKVLRNDLFEIDIKDMPIRTKN